MGQTGALTIVRVKSAASVQPKTRGIALLWVRVKILAAIGALRLAAVPVIVRLKRVLFVQLTLRGIVLMNKHAWTRGRTGAELIAATRRVRFVILPTFMPVQTLMHVQVLAENGVTLLLETLVGVQTLVRFVQMAQNGIVILNKNAVVQAENGVQAKGKIIVQTIVQPALLILRGIVTQKTLAI